MARQPKITIACGLQGSGKSIETLDIIYKYIQGNAAEGIPPRKALIFDANDEFGSFEWKDGQKMKIKAIAYSDLLKFTLHPTIEVRRLRPVWDDGRKMTINEMSQALSMILETYRNGLLLVEDINKYTSDTIPGDVIGALATCRHIGIDLFTNFQLLGKAGHPKIWGMASYLRLHKTRDSVATAKEARFGDLTEAIGIAEYIIDKRFRKGLKEKTSDKFFYVLIDKDYGKVYGDFTKAEAEIAIEEYISDYVNIDSMLKKKDRNGRKIYTDYTTAFSTIEQKLLDDYFEFH